ncbi:uncharacterized protein [Littorina saxatilis]|uniref:Uncharacterized protein n=1 Tax=Littorina saxatilis TaxID=31220 RepID=A0AAN9BH29_9CAEN
MSNVKYFWCFSIFLILSALEANGSKDSCASFKTYGEPVTAIDNTSATLFFSVTNVCKNDSATKNIKVQQKNEQPPHLVICNIDLSNGGCDASPGCTCGSRSHNYSVTSLIEGPLPQQWELVGQLQNGEEFQTNVWVNVTPTDTLGTQPPDDIVIDDVTTSEEGFISTDTIDDNELGTSSPEMGDKTPFFMTSMFGFMLLAIIGCVFLMVLVVAILVGFLFKRRSRTESLPPPPAPHAFRPPALDAVMFHVSPAVQDHRDSFLSVQGHIYHEISDDSEPSTTPVLSEVYFDSSSFSDDTGPEGYLHPVASDSETATSSRIVPQAVAGGISQEATPTVVVKTETGGAEDLSTVDMVTPKKDPPYQNIVNMS